MLEFDKRGGEKCAHQRHGVGCAIYPSRPRCCRVWNCRWLAGDATGSRPDRAHYVVDIMPDYITMVPHDGSPSFKVPVIQVWLDPKHPEAHRDPKLRRFLDQQKMAAIVRLNERDGFVLAPPSVNADGTWFEGGGVIEEPHTLEQKLEAIGPITIEISTNGS